MKIKSKHNNLLNYFIHDHQDLSPAYVRSCEKFFDSICWPKYYGGTNTNGKIYKLNKPQAASSKRQAPSATERPQLKNIIKMKGINNEKEYKEHS
jgi:hypothetical protein